MAAIKSAFLNLFQLKFLRVQAPMKSHLFTGTFFQIFLIFNAIYNNGSKSVIFSFIEFKAYRSLKGHILLYDNGLAIWHGYSDITHIGMG